MAVTIRLEYDTDTENPMEHDGQWTLYSFSNRHVNYKHPDEIMPDGKIPIGLRRKLDVGLAFFLDYFEHGQCVWSLAGDGPQCQWDTERRAGILIWEHSPKEMGAKDRESRAKDARDFLETYTAWCNGECYGWSIEDEDGEHIDSCWGYYGNDTDYMFQCIEDAWRDTDEPAVFKGDAAPLADFNARARAMMAYKPVKAIKRWEDPAV